MAAEIAELAGDAETLPGRALDPAEVGEHRLASGLADLALEAAPENGTGQRQVADVYEMRAGEAESLMAGNSYSSAAAYAESGRPFR